jgi:hypothetical protein
VGDAFELVETTSLGGPAAVEIALFDSSNFSVENVTAPAMTEVNTTPERTMLSGLFIFLLSYTNSRQESTADG